MPVLYPLASEEAHGPTMANVTWRESFWGTKDSSLVRKERHICMDALQSLLQLDTLTSAYGTWYEPSGDLELFQLRTRATCWGAQTGKVGRTRVLDKCVEPMN